MTTTSSDLKRLWPHAREWLHDYQWILIAISWCIAFFLGYIGFRRYFIINGESRSPLDVAYLTIQLFTLESGTISGNGVTWPLEIARLLAPIVTAYTAIKALTVIFSDQFRQFRIYQARNHIVICGLGRKGYLLTKSFRQRGDQVVVIEQDEDNDRIQQCKAMGAVVWIGNATSIEMLQHARVHRARAIISVCGDDGTNAAVAVRSHELFQLRHTQELSCIIHIIDPQLCDLLRQRAAESEREEDGFHLKFFNIFESGAHALLRDYPAFSTSSNGVDQVHPLIIGLGRMGENIVLEAVQLWQALHFDKAKRLPITVIDREAKRKIASLQARYPDLKEACDLQFLQMDVRDVEFRLAEFLYRLDSASSQPDRRSRMSIIYVCMDDDSLNLSSALILYHKLRSHPIPIVVRLLRSSGLAQLLQDGRNHAGSFANLHAFGLLDQTCTPEILLSENPSVTENRSCLQV